MSKLQNSYTDTKLIQPIKKYTFIFVCQKGRIEIETLFLVASLKRFLKCDYELIAVLPEPKDIFGEPSDITLNFFKKMGVRIERVTNDFIVKAASKGIAIDPSVNKALFLANKAYALQMPVSADKIIFVDSDMLFYKEFTGDICFSIPFNAGLAGAGLYVSCDGEWERIFKTMDVGMPNLRIKLIRKTDGRAIFTPPIFNDSFYGIQANLAHELSEIWIEFSKKIFFKKIIKNFNKTGEISFNLAIHKMRIPYNIFNIDYKNLPHFHYYSKIDKVKNNFEITSLAKSIVKEYPEIKNMVADNPNWAFVLE